MTPNTKPNITMLSKLHIDFPEPHADLYLNSSKLSFKNSSHLGLYLYNLNSNKKNEFVDVILS